MHRLKRVIVFLGVNGLLFGLVALLLVRSGQFRVHQIQLTVAEDPAGKAVFEEHQGEIWKRLEAIKGKAIWEVDVGNIARSLEGLSWLDSFRVRRIFPSTISVEVSAKPVAAVIVTDQGRLIPLSHSAELLPTLPAAKFPDVPIIRDRRLLKNPNLRTKAVEVLRDLPDRGPLRQTNVAEISSDKDNQFWISLMEENLRIKIGTENIPLRASRVEKVIEYLRSNSLNARVIDADFSKKVVVKLRKDR